MILVSALIVLTIKLKYKLKKINKSNLGKNNDENEQKLN